MNTNSAMASTLAGNARRAASPIDLRAKDPRSASVRGPTPSSAQTGGVLARSRAGRIALGHPGGAMRGRAGERQSIGSINAVEALANALAQRFPVVKRLAGDEFFNTMVQAYAVADFARSSVMLRSGDSFPAFIDHFEQARPIPYLGDVARLEMARAVAHRAADVASLGPDAFAAFPSDRLCHIRVSLHQSLSVVASLHPIYSIWHMNRDPVRFTPMSPWVGEAVLISRPRRVRTRRITHGDAVFIFALRAGYNLADAMAAAAQVVPGVSAGSLAMLIDARAVIGFDDDASAQPTPSVVALSKCPRPQHVSV